MVEISGIIKLRLVVTILFIMMITILGISVMVTNMELAEEEEFYNSLSSDELDQLTNIYSDYEGSDYSGMYLVTGWMMYIATGVLFFLMLRVWKTNNIY